MSLVMLVVLSVVGGIGLGVAIKTLVDDRLGHLIRKMQEIDDEMELLDGEIKPDKEVEARKRKWSTGGLPTA